MKEGLFPGILNKDYHSPKYDALSSSLIKKLLISPSHYKAAIDPSRPDTTNQNLIFGSAAHSMILEPEKASILTCDVGYRTKAFKEQSEALEGDKVLITKDDHETILRMREVLFKTETAKTLLTGGKAELSGFWKHEIYDFWCKFRIDLLQDDFNLIVDYKTSSDASEDGFSKAVFNYGYHIQTHWYRKGFKALTGKEYDFVFVVQEKTPPYAVAFYSLGFDHLSIASEQVTKACVIYDECNKNNNWDAGYPDQIQTLKVPGWAR